MRSFLSVLGFFQSLLPCRSFLPGISHLSSLSLHLQHLPSPELSAHSFHPLFPITCSHTLSTIKNRALWGFPSSPCLPCTLFSLFYPFLTCPSPTLPNSQGPVPIPLLAASYLKLFLSLNFFCRIGAYLSCGVCHILSEIAFCLPSVSPLKQ